MLTRRIPKPALRPLVRMLWASNGKHLGTFLKKIRKQTGPAQ